MSDSVFISCIYGSGGLLLREKECHCHRSHHKNNNYVGRAGNDIL